MSNKNIIHFDIFFTCVFSPIKVGNMIKKYDENHFIEEIKRHSSFIDEKMKNDTDKNRDALAKDMLDEMRHLYQKVLGALSTKYGKVNNFSNEYDIVSIAENKLQGQFPFLNGFNRLLNISVGHTCEPKEVCERLALKYWDRIIRLKKLVKQEFNLDILNYLTLFPLDMDETFESYYRKIADALVAHNEYLGGLQNDYFYYILKKKPIYCNGILFYEYTFTEAYDKNSKFDTFTAFSTIDAFPNYCVRAHFEQTNVDLFDQQVAVNFLTAYEVSIRPCEMKKLAYMVDVIEPDFKFDRGDLMYRRLMTYIQTKQMPLDKIVVLEKRDYALFLKETFSSDTASASALKSMLNKCRSMILNSRPGKNVIIYLLHHAKNDVIRAQFTKNRKGNPRFGFARIGNASLNFDEAPFALSPHGHVVKFDDLVDCFDINEHKNELLSRFVSDSSKDDSVLYNPVGADDLPSIQEKVRLCNDSLPDIGKPGRIGIFGRHLFVEEYESLTHQIIAELLQLSKTASFTNYVGYANSRLSNTTLSPNDDETKINALPNVFGTGNVFAVYGPAGTGKTTFARLLLQLLSDKRMKVVGLTTTHAAANNLAKKVGWNIETSTIAKSLESNLSTDLLILDECSTISARNMSEILSKVKFKYLLLLGDVHQIEAIDFGNWFGLLQFFLKEGESFINLDKPHRARNNEILPIIWKAARDCKPELQELIDKNLVSHALDQSIFERKSEDEVILCLNYGGLYGINNINRYLQNRNGGKSISWKQYVFKVDDHVLFNENSTSPDLYNNLKGTIVDVFQDEKQLKFTIRVKRTFEYCGLRDGFSVLRVEDDGDSLIELSVRKTKPDYTDDDSADKAMNKIPFQLAYAISIHKAQGLEYESVKVILTNEVEEKISHNIFYTAITRAANDLTIYWTPETEKEILENIQAKNCRNDASILKARFADLQN